MLKRSAFLTCFILVGSIGTSKAEPLDSPDVAYINGLPCNRACQFYMAWSRHSSGQTILDSPQTEVPQQSPRAESKPKAMTAREPTRTRFAKEIAQNRKARRPALASVGRGLPLPIARTGGAALQASNPLTTGTGKTSENAEAASPVQDLTGTVQHFEQTTVPNRPTDPQGEKVSKPVAPVASTQDQTAAVTPLQTPAATEPQPSEKVGEKIADSEIKPSAKTATLSPPADDQLVAVLLVRREIKSLSDLSNKVVAIDASDSVSRTKKALVSAGARDVQLSEGEKMALLRVMNGEVPAAVVTLASPQQAATWSNVPGFNVLRIPLAPSLEKTGPG